MTYYNPVFVFGLKGFARTAVDAGVDGLIVPDLPYEESRAAARRGRAGRAGPGPVRGADLDAGAREGHRAAQPRLHLRRVAHRRHRRAAGAAARPRRAGADAAAGDHQARVRGLRRVHAGAGGGGRASWPTASSSARPSCASSSATPAPPSSSTSSAPSSNPSRRHCGGRPWPGSRASRRRRRGPQEGRHRRGPVDQVRLVQGDHGPRRGGAGRARVSEVPLSLPHLLARAHRAPGRRRHLRGVPDRHRPAWIR